MFKTRPLMKTKRFAIFLTLGLLAVNSLIACTIIKLVSDDLVLAGNNEDWYLEDSRIWFTPADTDRFGAVYVGFNNGYPQGGMNEHGLFYDVVAGREVEWKRDRNKKNLDGNPGQLILEKAATVGEALEYFRENNVPEFSYAKFLLADRSGNSAVVSFKNSELFFEFGQDPQVQYLGFGQTAVADRLNDRKIYSLEKMQELLLASVQSGDFPTQYSNIFNLRTGDLYISHSSDRKNLNFLNLKAELTLGEHFYHIPHLKGDRLEQGNRKSAILKFECFIDGMDLLYINAEKLWYTHLEWELPGKWDGNNHPTIVNNKSWYPVWNDGVSEPYLRVERNRMKENIRMDWDNQNFAIRVLTPRGVVKIIEQPSENNDQTLTLEIDDSSPSGAAWYRFEIYPSQ